MNMDYIFTKHLTERYCERIIQIKKREIEKYIQQNCPKIHGIIKSRISKSVEVVDEYSKSMFKKMHQDNFENTTYLVDGKTIFVCVNVNGIKSIRTCFNINGAVGHFIKKTW